MELLGLSLSQVLAVAAGFGVAVVGLYLLRLRRRRVEVPFVPLWDEVLAESPATRLFQALKRLLSLLIALLVVASLAMALGDPRFAGAADEGKTTVVLVDVSASMQATDVEEEDRLAAATASVERLTEGIGPQDRMLIASMEDTTVPLGPVSSDPTLLRESLEGLAPTDLAADLDGGLRFALDVLRGREEGRREVVLVSDGVLGAVSAEVEESLAELEVDLRWSRIGRGGRNVAITAFSVRRFPLDTSRSQVLVELWNPGEDDETVELILYGDGAELDVERIRLAAGERLARFFDDITGADRTLEARVRLADGTGDDQPADDRAYARLPERRRARVLAVSPGNLYLSAALLLDEYLEVVEATPDQYPVEGRFDVTIFDRWVPPEPPSTPALYLYPTSDDPALGPFEVSGEVERPYFDRIERRHPIVRFTALGDVNIASALDVTLQDGDRVIGGERGAPLLVEGSRQGRPMVALLFDVRESDLPLRVAWPLLLLNTIDFFVQENAGYLSGVRTGEPWSLPVPSSATEAELVSPDGTTRTVPVVQGRATATGRRAGFYTVRAGGEEDVVAANLGPTQEARMTPAETVEVGGQALAPPTVGPRGRRLDLWVLLVLAAAIVLSVEWLTYHRRWTV